MSSLIRDLAGGSAEMLEVFDDKAVVKHALAFEAALAKAQAAEGLLSDDEASRIAIACAHNRGDCPRRGIRQSQCHVIASAAGVTEAKFQSAERGNGSFWQARESAADGIDAVIIENGYR